MNFSCSGDISPERRTFCEPFIGDNDDMLGAARSCTQAMQVCRVRRNAWIDLEGKMGGRLVPKRPRNVLIGCGRLSKD